MTDLHQRIYDANKSEPLNIYMYGSTVYGTLWNPLLSDKDLIVILKDEPRLEKIWVNDFDIQFYSVDSFQKMIDDHEISALECLFLPEHLIVKQRIKFDFELDLVKLRHSISRKSSNSWVKAKKKLLVEKDYDPYIAKKSLFHSLRIIEFGTQIALHKRIADYTSCNIFFEDIIGMDNIEWAALSEKYKPIKNRMMTEFRRLAPKE